MTEDNLHTKILMIMFIFVAIGIFIMYITAIIEILTREVVGVEKYKCIDKLGGEFKDEYCTREVECGIIIKSIGQCKVNGEVLK